MHLSGAVDPDIEDAFMRSYVRHLSDAATRARLTTLYRAADLVLGKNGALWGSRELLVLTGCVLSTKHRCRKKVYASFCATWPSWFGASQPISLQFCTNALHGRVRNLLHAIVFHSLAERQSQASNVWRAAAK